MQRLSHFLGMMRANNWPGNGYGLALVISIVSKARRGVRRYRFDEWPAFAPSIVSTAPPAQAEGTLARISVKVRTETTVFLIKPPPELLALASQKKTKSIVTVICAQTHMLFHDLPT
jgi:hypothetical protein